MILTATRAGLSPIEGAAYSARGALPAALPAVMVTSWAMPRAIAGNALANCHWFVRIEGTHRFGTRRRAANSN